MIVMVDILDQRYNKCHQKNLILYLGLVGDGIMNKTRLFLFAIILLSVQAQAAVDRLRCMWRDDPATTMVVGWDQVYGTNPVIYFDKQDHGRNFNGYKQSKRPDHMVEAKGMKNHFARLGGLEPNTVYYFIIKDSEGISNRFSFKTAPADASYRLSIIAGGDSRNHREARQSANTLVAKLRPHVVLFNGDMTVRDGSSEWIEWFDDWQLTIHAEGRITPVLVARGNHETENKTLLDLFDLPHPGNFYALTFGGSLLRIYTLNTMIPAGGIQAEWLENDLRQHNATVSWKIAQYHHAMRPHTSAKTEKDELYLHWARIFHDFGIRLAIESDSHVVKWTHPIRPDTGPDSDMGFVRDDASGTVFVGEGCWGAPLRENDDDKAWTRASGSFNQFNWIFVDKDKIEVRTVMTDGSSQVGEVSPANIFEPPIGLPLWSPPGGDVIRLYQRKKEAPVRQLAEESVTPQSVMVNPGAAHQDVGDNSSTWESLPKLQINPATGRIKVDYELSQKADVTLILMNTANEVISQLSNPAQEAGAYSKSLDMSKLPRGKFLLTIKAGELTLKRLVVLRI
jgi:acid phosphatase type 7